MQQIHTTFEGVLTRLSTKRIQEKSLTEGDEKDQSEKVVMLVNIRFTDRTNGAQMFLDGMQTRWGVQGVRNLFTPPLAWKSLNVELTEKLEFAVTFDEQQFDARLKAIKVRRAFKKDVDEVNYDLEFERELDKDSDLMLSYYLNLRQEDPETGKRSLQFFYVELKPLDSGDAE
jgi:hypothetical protein